MLYQLSYTPGGAGKQGESRFTPRPLLVGPDRVELSTSRLSSARSNQLSYGPDKFGSSSGLGPKSVRWSKSSGLPDLSKPNSKRLKFLRLTLVPSEDGSLERR